MATTETMLIVHRTIVHLNSSKQEEQNAVGNGTAVLRLERLHALHFERDPFYHADMPSQKAETYLATCRTVILASITL